MSMAQSSSQTDDCGEDSHSSSTSIELSSGGGVGDGGSDPYPTLSTSPSFEPEGSSVAYPPRSFFGSVARVADEAIISRAANLWDNSAMIAELSGLFVVGSSRTRSDRFAPPTSGTVVAGEHDTQHFYSVST